MTDIPEYCRGTVFSSKERPLLGKEDDCLIFTQNGYHARLKRDQNGELGFLRITNFK